MRKILLFSLISIQGIFSLSDTYAQCSSAPTISTPTATSITTTSATIGATLVGNGGGSGCDATYGVRYSTTTPVGASNEIIDGTTSSDGVVFTASLAGLTPGTKYYYTG